MMNTDRQLEITLDVAKPRGRGRRESTKPPEPEPVRIPRITRLMALAIKFQEMINRGEVRDYADLARLGYVTRARLTQIMNLLLLAPDIQRSFLEGTAPLEFTERHARRLTRIVFWDEQRMLFDRADPRISTN